jgi:hypothetical protein
MTPARMRLLFWVLISGGVLSVMAAVTFADTTTLVPGAVIEDLGFVSVTTNKAVAQGFIGHGSRGVNVLFDLKLPKGLRAAHVGSITGDSHEKEVLLARGSRISITKVEVVELSIPDPVLDKWYKQKVLQVTGEVLLPGTAMSRLTSARRCAHAARPYRSPSARVGYEGASPAGRADARLAPPGAGAGGAGCGRPRRGKAPGSRRPALAPVRVGRRGREHHPSRGVRGRRPRPLSAPEPGRIVYRPGAINCTSS